MSGYIGTQPVPQATQTRNSFTCTAGQTSFATSGFTPNFLDVYLNGVKLTETDYTASNGSDVVLASGAAAGDVLEVVAFSTFDVVTDTITAAGTALTLDRTGSNGTILDLKKDGTNVGSIKSRNSESLMIGSDYGSDAYICLSNDNVFPVTSTGAVKDAATNLGVSTGRWKDLYLSGGVFLGGIGSSNKLEDYEEGTWTPIYYDANTATELAGVVYNSRRYGKYTKVGNLVTIYFQIITDTMTLTGSASNDVWLSGLPFPVGTLSDSDGNSDIGAYVAASPNTFNDIPIRVEASAGYTGFILRTSTGTFEINDMQTGSFDNNLQGSITYPTNA